MYRRILTGYLSVITVLLHLVADARAQPKPDPDPKPSQAGEIYVIVKARLYEVDGAFHDELAKAKWLSKADLEELEAKANATADSPLFVMLKKYKPLQVGKEIQIDPGKEETLLTATQPAVRLPNPAQIWLGKKNPQIIDEGLTLRAEVHISADQRFVLTKFLEKSQEIEGIERIKVVMDDKGIETEGELVFVKKASISRARYVPDGGTILVPLQYRSNAARKNNRWWVVEVTMRIYIEEEERWRRGQPPK